MADPMASSLAYCSADSEATVVHRTVLSIVRNARSGVQRRAQSASAARLGRKEPGRLDLGKDRVEAAGAVLAVGIGVGGILASTNVIASEFSNARNRGLAIGIIPG
jgi:hypothetical protein